jgi:hypothetical protein
MATCPPKITTTTSTKNLCTDSELLAIFNPIRTDINVNDYTYFQYKDFPNFSKCYSCREDPSRENIVNCSINKLKCTKSETTYYYGSKGKDGEVKCVQDNTKAKTITESCENYVEYPPSN